MTDRTVVYEMSICFTKQIKSIYSLYTLLSNS